MLRLDLTLCLLCLVRYLNLVNDGFIQLSLDCMTTTDYCFPTLYYDLKFGGVPEKPYVCRKGECKRSSSSSFTLMAITNGRLSFNRTGPVFSLSKGPRQFYSYGTVNLLTIPVTAFQNDFRHFTPNNNLYISLKLFTFIEVNDAHDVREIKMYDNPTSEALMNDLSQLLKEPKYSDVTITCSGGALKAHKCILAGW